MMQAESRVCTHVPQHGDSGCAQIYVINGSYANVKYKAITSHGVYVRTVKW
jgi:hypothetical protein